MAKHTQDLLTLVLPRKGNSISAADYRRKLDNLGYNFYQQIGSIGGSSSAGSVSINSNAIITRQ